MANTSLFKGAAACAAVMLLAACGGPSIEGEWIEPVPGMEDQVQGFCLEKGGKASSINMATLQFDRWERRDSMLILSGKSIGNGLTIEFSDTLTIRELTDTGLTLANGDITTHLTRR